MQEHLRTLLDRRSNRAVRAIMGVAERELFDSLSRSQQAALRQVVRDMIHDYHQVVLDVVDQVDEGNVALNTLWLDKIDEIHRSVVPLAGPERPEPLRHDGHRSAADGGAGRPIAVP